MSAGGAAEEGLREVAPGLFRLRMPLPFALDHVNLWLLADGDEWVAVDAGLATEPLRQRWQAAFTAVLAGRPIRRVLVTHMHPDHAGLAGWLVETWSAELLMSQAEWLTGRMLTLDDGGALDEAAARFHAACGAPAELVAALRRRGNVYRASVLPLPARYSRLRHGDALDIGGRRWRVMTGAGHSPEMVCLYCHADRLLVAGDQILPRISPHVGVWGMEPGADPLGDYLDSLERFRILPDDVQVLPSHGEPFAGLRERCAELADHHARRLDETLAACRRPVTAAEVSAVLFHGRDFDLHQSVFALGEAVAHLNHLVERRRLTRTVRQDGVWSFAAR